LLLRRSVAAAQAGIPQFIQYPRHEQPGPRPGKSACKIEKPAIEPGKPPPNGVPNPSEDAGLTQSTAATFKLRTDLAKSASSSSHISAWSRIQVI
jgi:hypothetical protein